jgi:hypothetical protein
MSKVLKHVSLTIIYYEEMITAYIFKHLFFITKAKVTLFKL